MPAAAKATIGTATEKLKEAKAKGTYPPPAASQAASELSRPKKKRVAAEAREPEETAAPIIVGETVRAVAPAEAVPVAGDALVADEASATQEAQDATEAPASSATPASVAQEKGGKVDLTSGPYAGWKRKASKSNPERTYLLNPDSGEKVWEKAALKKLEGKGKQQQQQQQQRGTDEDEQKDGAVGDEAAPAGEAPAAEHSSTVAAAAAAAAVAEAEVTGTAPTAGDAEAMQLEEVAADVTNDEHSASGAELPRVAADDAETTAAAAEVSGSDAEAEAPMEKQPKKKRSKEKRQTASKSVAAASTPRAEGKRKRDDVPPTAVDLAKAVSAVLDRISEDSQGAWMGGVSFGAVLDAVGDQLGADVREQKPLVKEIVVSECRRRA